MSTTVTYRGQQFSVGSAEDPGHTQVMTEISFPINGLSSAALREGLERRSRSSTEIQFAMIIDIEYDNDGSLVEDCIEMFRHAGIGLCHSPLEYREAYSRYEAVDDSIQVGFNFTLQGWKMTFAVLCPSIHPMTDGLPEPDILNQTYLRFATEEALSVLLDQVAPPEGA